MKQIDIISMKDLLDKTNCILRKDDIILISDDIETVTEFMNNFGKEFNSTSVKKFLIEHKDTINKKKLVFLLSMNYRENLKQLKEIMKQDEERKDFKAFKEHYNQYQLQTTYKEEAERLAKGLDVYLYSNVIDEEGIVEYIDILSSKEIIDKQINSGKKQKNRFDRINNTVKNGKGFSYIAQSIVLTDLEDIVCTDLKLGQYIRDAILNNIAIKEKVATKEQLDYLRMNDAEAYIDIIDNIDNRNIPEELTNMLEKHIKYIDIDKFLLDAAYRYEEALENGIMPKDTLPSIKVIVGMILDNIEKKYTSIEGTIQAKKDNKLVDILYKYSDIEKLFDRIQGEEYLSKEELNFTKTMVLEGQMKISTIPENLLYLNNFSNEQLMNIMLYNKDNFIYVTKILGLNEEEITNQLLKLEKGDKELIIDLIRNDNITIKSALDVFYKGKINAEFFKEFSEEVDISSEVNLQTINELYHQTKKSKEPNEEDLSKLSRQIELYKMINIEGKSKEEIEEASENVIYEIGEEFDKQNKDITLYFENGLLTLNTVADWTGDSFIEKLYNESKITFQDLEKLYNNKKISQTLIEKAILENQELEYAELMAYIYLGYVSENKIEELYMSGKIFDSTLEEIALQGKISPQKYLELTTQRTKEVLEENSKIKLELVNIPDKKEINGIVIKENDERITDTSYKVPVKNNKTLIDPGARYKFLELLGAIDAKAIIPDEDNAFYNYEFFVIPDANGELQANSVVIAERIWEDKEDQTKGLATENATYFFQYKDLMVNSNLSKKEMSQERDKIISTANHRIGSWAVSVLYRIAQTTKSSNLKDYKKGDERATVVIDELLKLYSHEQLKEILNMAKEIDDDLEYLIEEEIER